MKLEDLKKLAIGAGGSSIRVEITPPGSPILTATVNLGIDSGMFNDRQTALLAAARFRASEEMYQEIEKQIEFLKRLRNYPIPVSQGDLITERLEALRCVLILADSTRELLPCKHSCSPSDWHEGGKCDQNGCFYK